MVFIKRAQEQLLEEYFQEEPKESFSYRLDDETFTYKDKTTVSINIEKTKEVVLSSGIIERKQISRTPEDNKRSTIRHGSEVRIPKEIMKKLNWKIGDKLWFEIIDEKIQTIEVGKIASSAEDIKKAMKALIKDD